MKEHSGILYHLQNLIFLPLSHSGYPVNPCSHIWHSLPATCSLHGQAPKSLGQPWSNPIVPSILQWQSEKNYSFSYQLETMQRLYLHSFPVKATTIPMTMNKITADETDAIMIFCFLVKFLMSNLDLGGFEVSISILKLNWLCNEINDSTLVVILLVIFQLEFDKHDKSSIV